MYYRAVTLQMKLVPYEPTLLTCCVELHRPLNPIKS
jgi:hypothetical protein